MGCMKNALTMMQNKASKDSGIMGNEKLILPSSSALLGDNLSLLLEIHCSLREKVSDLFNKLVLAESSSRSSFKVAIPYANKSCLR